MIRWIENKRGRYAWSARRVSTMSLALALLLESPLWAQAPGEQKAAWVLPYALVIALVGLSVYSVTRPSVRRKT